MSSSRHYITIGLMSGTSADGIDAALIAGDGMSHVHTIAQYHMAYDDAFRQRLLDCLNCDRDPDGRIAAVERDLTRYHAVAVDALLAQSSYNSGDIDLIGFHGHTIFHAPEKRQTWQIGDAGLLAAMTGIDVINDFRGHDVKNGGQGAPLLPACHRALVRDTGLALPVAIQNIGGVGNVTYIGAREADMLAFDTGPGNALIDDLVYHKTGRACDENGALAEQGKVHDALVQQWLSHPYFAKTPPKSLDRNDWDVFKYVEDLSVDDGAATLTAFTARSIARAACHFPQPVKHWYVAGGGRHNPVLMAMLAFELNESVGNVDTLGWQGDFIEAQGFAFLAIRAKLGYALTWPGTTGATKPLSGGVEHKADETGKARIS